MWRFGAVVSASDRCAQRAAAKASSSAKAISLVLFMMTSQCGFQFEGRGSDSGECVEIAVHRFVPGPLGVEKLEQRGGVCAVDVGGRVARLLRGGEKIGPDLIDDGARGEILAPCGSNLRQHLRLQRL